MKAILMSIRPKYVADILNRKKTIEIRKKFPSDYVGWVYVYVTNSRKHYLVDRYVGVDNIGLQDYPCGYETVSKKPSWSYNGKVVARFWCDKVEEILSKENGNFYTNFLSNRKLLTQSCLAQNELRDYMAGNWKQKFGYYWYGGYAIHITKVKPFDKPKEISEFYKLGAWKVYEEQLDSSYMKRTEQEIMKSLGQTLTRAPQSWCYVEI